MKHVQLQLQAGNIDSYPENHRDAHLSKAMTTNNDNNTISHRFAPQSPSLFYFIADDVVLEYEQHEYDEPDHNPSHSTINFDGVGTTTAEVDAALQGLSACVNQVMNNNNSNKKSKENAHRGDRSTRGIVHIRSML